MSRGYDYLIVGAGFSGLTLAERLATQAGATCLVVERRSHIGGNAYDHCDDHGVLVHDYGPHYFRTNSRRVRDYLSNFTEWHAVDYRILSWTHGAFWPFPINLNTFEQLIGRPSTTEEMSAMLEKWRLPVASPSNSEEVILSKVGRPLYEQFFEGYTLKQWGRHPRQLDASVCARIPIRTDRDDRYLTEEFQALPKAGYTRLFERMLSACGDRVEVLLNTDYREVLPDVKFRHMIYSGPVDEYFNFSEGRLPYRSLRFEHESFTKEDLVLRESVSGKAGFWQPAVQVNYPNDHDFTRIVEIKHATGQICGNTTIVREYPEEFGPGKEPYYPVPAPDSQAIHNRYRIRVQAETRTSFIGRLAAYKYYNMDQVVGMALAEFDRLRSRGSHP